MPEGSEFVHASEGSSPGAAAVNSRKQFEAGDVLRADEAEMASVKGADAGCAESLSDRDEAAVDAAEMLIGVLNSERCDSSPIGCRERLDANLAGRRGLVQRGFGRRSELPVDQPSGLGDHEPGRDERSGMRLQQLPAGPVVGIASIGGSEQHAGVDDQRQRPNPSASMSSASAAVRPELDAPIATNPSFRRPWMCSASTRAASSSAVTDWRAASSASRAARSSGSRTFTLMSRVYRRGCRPETASLLKIESGRAPRPSPDQLLAGRARSERATDAPGV